MSPCDKAWEASCERAGDPDSADAIESRKHPGLLWIIKQHPKQWNLLNSRLLTAASLHESTAPSVAHGGVYMGACSAASSLQSLTASLIPFWKRNGTDLVSAGLRSFQLSLNKAI